MMILVTQTVVAQYPQGGNAARQQPSVRQQSPGQYQQQQQQPRLEEPQLITQDIHQSIRNLLAVNSKRIPNTGSSMPSDLLAYCFPYGFEAMTYVPTSAPSQPNQQAKGESIYAIGALCWNFPCRGMTMLRASNSHIFAKVGHGYQPQPGALLAMLAFSQITPDYEMKISEKEYAIADLIKSEQYQCSSRVDMSMVLVGLSFYLTPKDEWKNRLNEKWSLKRVVAEELTRRPDQSNVAATNQLLGLSAAIQCYERNNAPLEDVLLEAQRSIEEYQKFAFSIQNPSGLWHPLFFSYKGDDPNPDSTLYASAHILRFLVFSLPDDQLRDPRLAKAVTALASRVAKVRSNLPLSDMSGQQLEGLTTALHALKIYDERLYPER